MTIDTHVHFWQYSPEEFGWIGDDMASIRRDFLPADYRGADGLIAVQARQSVTETVWLAELAMQHPIIRGIVGWLPLASPQIEPLLEERHPKLVGLRHVLQAESPAFFADAAFNDGLAVLARSGLAYDLLVTEPQLPATIELVDRHPTLTFIVDHLAKPELKAGPSTAWRQGITKLARRSNVYCKVSGGITEANLRWQPAEMTPYFEVVLEAFGAWRLMFGSNWPVAEAAGGYSKWTNAVWDWAAKLTPSENEDLFSNSAARAYRLQEAL
jgi:L-fuconolactonase